MPRARIRVAVVALVVLSVGTLALRPARAQEATPMARTGHPLVGAWVLDRDVTQPTNPLQLIVATADGLYLGVAYGGSTAVGVWEATGPRTAAVTLRVPAPIEGVPFVGEAVIRGTVEVAADGLSFTAPYTLEVVTADGSRSGEYGVTTAQGTRITVEQMGDPEGTLAELEGATSATPTP